MTVPRLAEEPTVAAQAACNHRQVVISVAWHGDVGGREKTWMRLQLSMRWPVSAADAIHGVAASLRSSHSRRSPRGPLQGGAPQSELPCAHWLPCIDLKRTCFPCRRPSHPPLTQPARRPRASTFACTTFSIAPWPSTSTLSRRSLHGLSLYAHSARQQTRRSDLHVDTTTVAGICQHAFFDIAIVNCSANHPNVAARLLRQLVLAALATTRLDDNNDDTARPAPCNLFHHANISIKLASCAA